jgi:hypothetical protein
MKWFHRKLDRLASLELFFAAAWEQLSSWLRARFWAWFRVWVGYLMGPDFWTYHSDEYDFQRTRDWHAETRRLKSHALKERRRRDRKLERRSGIGTSPQEADVELERDRVRIFAALESQRKSFPVEKPKRAAWAWSRWQFLSPRIFLQKLRRRAKTFVFALRHLFFYPLRRWWVQFKWFFFYLFLRAHRSLLCRAQNSYLYGECSSYGLYRLRKLHEFVMRARKGRLAKKRYKDLEWQKILNMSFIRRVEHYAIRARKIAQARFDLMKLQPLLVFEGRVVRVLFWLTAPLRAIGRFLVWSVVRPFFSFIGLLYRRSMARLKKIKKWLGDLWGWFVLEAFRRRYYNRVFLSKAWVEAEPYSIIAWYKAFRKVLLYFFVFILLFIDTVLIFAWNYGGHPTTVAFWVFVSHSIVFLIDWAACPGGFREAIQRTYAFFYDMIVLPPDPYNGVYERMLEERKKEEKRRLKELRRQRIKAGLEHTWWRLTWLFIVYSWEYAVGLLWYAGDLTEAFFFDLRRKSIRLWKNRRAVAEALWVWVCWWAWRFSRPFRRLRTWWEMRKHR